MNDRQFDSSDPLNRIITLGAQFKLAGEVKINLARLSTDDEAHYPPSYRKMNFPKRRVHKNRADYERHRNKHPNEALQEANSATDQRCSTLRATNQGQSSGDPPKGNNFVALGAPSPVLEMPHRFNDCRQAFRATGPGMKDGRKPELPAPTYGKSSTFFTSKISTAFLGMRSSSWAR
jgi:hypothetical protein